VAEIKMRLKEGDLVVSGTAADLLPPKCGTKII
jgi:hypothetical protein